MQQLIVALIVVAAALFATWRLLGAAVRLKVLAWALERVPAASGLARLLQRLQQQQRAALLGAGCGQCSKAKSH
jgi:hypothetical protein